MGPIIVVKTPVEMNALKVDAFVIPESLREERGRDDDKSTCCLDSLGLDPSPLLFRVLRMVRLIGADELQDVERSVVVGVYLR